ncbi:MAG: SDR family oxidoreductase [Isosphaeraceae bacterium]
MANGKDRAGGKVVVVTGATRGLGRAMTGGFVRAGHTVAGCGRTTADVTALREAFPPPNEFHVVDVTEEPAVRAWAKGFLERLGPPDLLINNAATINRNARLWEVPSDEFDRVIDVNLKGIAHVIRHVLPAMLTRGTGVVVNFSSGWGRSVSAEVAPYCASKWGVEGLTRALAEELPKGMAAVAMNPGIIDTAMLRSCFGEQARSYPGPKAWADSAVPYLLQLGPKDNGQSATVPGMA